MRAFKNLFFKWQMTQLRCFPTERLVRWGPGLDTLGQTLRGQARGAQLSTEVCESHQQESAARHALLNILSASGPSW